MPILSQLPGPDLPFPQDWMDPDTVPRAVVTVGIDSSMTGRLELAPHAHPKAQFFLSLRGVITCEAESGFWLVPPRSALWIPAGMRHALTVEGVVEGYAAYVQPAALPDLPASCCTFQVTPLMRELLIRSASFPVLYPEDGFEARLIGLLLEEISRSPPSTLHLPVPEDRRVRQLVDMMLAEPAERGTIATWARRAGLSERTLSRLIAQQTGMSFGRWRQQIGIMLAVQKLAKGASIQQVAADLGYESTSSFVTMFRKALGMPPGRYLASQLAAVGGR